MTKLCPRLSAPGLTKNKTEEWTVMNRKLVTGFLLAAVLGLSGVKANAQAASGTQTAPAATPSASAVRDQDIEMLRKDIRSKKKQLIAANLQLTDAESTKFWPVYDQYTADLVKINNEKYALMKDYADAWGTMTDAQAEGLTKRALAVDDQVTQL